MTHAVITLRAVFSPLVSVYVCSRLTKTDMELEVLHYINRISSEAHKMVRIEYVHGI